MRNTSSTRTGDAIRQTALEKTAKCEPCLRDTATDYVYHRTLRTIRTRDAQDGCFSKRMPRGEKSGRHCRAERAMRSDTVRRKSHYFGMRSDIFMALAAALSSERSSSCSACLHCASIAAVNRECRWSFFIFAPRGRTRASRRFSRMREQICGRNTCIAH